MRGTRTALVGCLFVCGIIPAYAGNTRYPVMTPIPPGDHPRVCGEHLRLQKARYRFRGSSPRMRGTLPSHCRPLNRRGIIPAYAGNTNVNVAQKFSSWDHPRVCGEHLRLQKARYRFRGSSPRMRGTLPSHCRPLNRRGIIPAYAGNTNVNVAQKFSSWDHPRVCGEHAIVAARPRTRPGSSPRMRGTLGCGHLILLLRVDHPRVCGEHAIKDAMNKSSSGSSPRMRGTPARLD